MTIKSVIYEMVLAALEESIPSTVSRGRLAVVNGPAKIKKIGGFHNISAKTFHIGDKEVGHTENGRDYLDKDIIQKHGFSTLSNSYMD
jgi:hypothetical protein